MLTDAAPRKASRTSFLESDRIKTLDLPQDGGLLAIAESIESAMKGTRTVDVRRACAEFQAASCPWVLDALILAAFIPIHVQLWAKFPVWYHLVFLGTLVPLVALGAALTRSRNSSAERGGRFPPT